MLALLFTIGALKCKRRYSILSKFAQMNEAFILVEDTDVGSTNTHDKVIERTYRNHQPNRK